MKTNEIKDESKKVSAEKDNFCPICGKAISTNEMVILDNGNPGCPDCAAAEE